MPSLLGSSRRSATRRGDRPLALSLNRPPSSLEGKAFILPVAHFFLPTPRMIEPSSSGAAARAEQPGKRRRGQCAVKADFRDLQVWHKLAWVDPFLDDTDARVNGLGRKARLQRGQSCPARSIESWSRHPRLLGPPRGGARSNPASVSYPYHPPEKKKKKKTYLPCLDTDITWRTHIPFCGWRQRSGIRDASAQLGAPRPITRQRFRRRPVAVAAEGSCLDAIVPLAAQPVHVSRPTRPSSPGPMNPGDSHGYGHLETQCCTGRPHSPRRGKSPVSFRTTSPASSVHLRQLESHRRRSDFVGASSKRPAILAGPGARAVVPIILAGENAGAY